MLEGLSPDVPIVTNEKGAMQSATPYRFDLLDAKSMFKLAEVLAYGATRYAPDNWRGISASDHYNHLMQHLFAWKAGDTQDDHLGHALCRAMMLCAVAEAEKEPTESPVRVGDRAKIVVHECEEFLGAVGEITSVNDDGRLILASGDFNLYCWPKQLERLPFSEALDEYAGKGVRKSDMPLEDLLL
jgi:hypothetical protein